MAALGALTFGCSDDRVVTDAGPGEDAAMDAGGTDAAMDAGSSDAGPSDAGPSDAGATDSGPSDAGPSETVGAWSPMAASPLSGRLTPAFAWSGAELIIWGGLGSLAALELLADGARYDPIADRWTAMSTEGAPAARQFPATAWVGDRFFVYGGRGALGTNLTDGALYDPAPDRWSTLADSPLGDRARLLGAAVVGAEEMVVGDGIAFYDPGADRWRQPSTVGAPTNRNGATVVWTGGRQVVVWGGTDLGASSGSLPASQGAIYDVEGDSWTAIDAAGAPRPRVRPAAAWDGASLVLWGGYDITELRSVGDGGRLDVASNVWRGTVSETGAPGDRTDMYFGWTGRRLLVWGGARSSGLTTREYLGDGFLYDPARNRWEALPELSGDAPTGREAGAFAWTGTQLLVWGGRRESDPLADGARYEL